MSRKNDFYQSYLPKYNEYVIFMKMVKGKRLKHMFYGNTECIQVEKREYLKDALYKAVEDGFFIITSGDQSIAETLSKKDLVKICKELNLPVSGNKIDLVKRIKCIRGEFFNSYEIDDWILATGKGRDVIENYDKEFKAQYDHLQQTIYNLLLNDRQSDSLKLFEMYRNSYPFEKIDGFFMHYNKEELRKLIKTIRSTNVFDKIGFPKKHANAFKTVMCLYFLFGDFDIKEKFEEGIEGATELIIRSPLIKNKDLPYVDLKDLVRGYPVRKFENR